MKEIEKVGGINDTNTIIQGKDKRLAEIAQEESLKAKTPWFGHDTSHLVALSSNSGHHCCSIAVVACSCTRV
eukprot:12463233-Ditylum_brightwellii.AAC.1